MKSFATLEEFFNSVRGLIANLEMRGETGAASELRSGLSCLNGLTDGYALFREAIRRMACQIDSRRGGYSRPNPQLRE